MYCRKCSKSPVVQILCASCLFDEAKPSGDVLDQHNQEKHEPERPEKVKPT